MPARKLHVEDGKLVIEKEGKLKKLVTQVEHVTFSGRRAVEQGQDITYVTERCVMVLTPEGVVLTEIAPGVTSRRTFSISRNFRWSLPATSS